MFMAPAATQNLDNSLMGLDGGNIMQNGMNTSLIDLDGAM